MSSLPVCLEKQRRTQEFSLEGADQGAFGVALPILPCHAPSMRIDASCQTLAYLLYSCLIFLFFAMMRRNRQAKLFLGVSFYVGAGALRPCRSAFVESGEAVSIA